MVLKIRSWFGEPDVEFKVSHKVHGFIREKLIIDIMQPFGLEERDVNTFIGLVVCTSSNCEQIEVRGPEYDKRNKFITYGLWLPYNKIVGVDHYLKEYLKYFFDALVVLFKHYHVPEVNMRELQSKVEDEVLENMNYEYLDN